MVEYRSGERKERGKRPDYQIEIVDGKERVFHDERVFDYCPYCESENLYYDSNFEIYVCGSCGKVWS